MDILLVLFIIEQHTGALCAMLGRDAAEVRKEMLGDPGSR